MRKVEKNRRPNVAESKTRTRTRKTTPEYRTKSDHARALFRSGVSIAEVTRTIPGMGYAFAYGIAKRLEASDPEFKVRMVAGARKIKSVRRDGDEVIVAVPGGSVRVNVQTGAVKRTK